MLLLELMIIISRVGLILWIKEKKGIQQKFDVNLSGESTSSIASELYAWLSSAFRNEGELV